MEDNVKLKRSEQGAATKKKLTESALRLFTERGYKNVSIVDICNEVGVTVGVYYHYFAAKSDVYKEMSLQTNNKMRAYQVQGEDFVEKISGVMHRYGELTAEIGRDTMSVIVTPANGLIYVNNRAAKLIRQLLEEGRAAGEVVQSIPVQTQLDAMLSMVWGTVLLWCAAKEEFDLTKALDERTAAMLESFREPTAV